VRSLETVAVHEAAHAVAAEQVGFGPTGVELLPDGAGTCYFDAGASSAETLPRLRRQLVVMLSGLLAEYIAAERIRVKDRVQLTRLNGAGHQRDWRNADHIQ
jgi:hypothetical protein